jgi:hypothetical protein
VELELMLLKYEDGGTTIGKCRGLEEIVGMKPCVLE